jgi:S1-C subfamily serine protease
MMVVRNVSGIEIQPAAEGKSAQFRPQRGGEGSGPGSASAIDERDYLLTAAHVLENAQSGALFVLAADGENLRSWPAEVVWRADYSAGEADLALIWSPTRLERVFRRSAEVIEGETLIGIGPFAPTNPRQPSELRLVNIAGAVEAIAFMRPGMDWLEVEHSAPSRNGDSGGPLVNTKGELVATVSRRIGKVQRIGPISIYSSVTRDIASRPANWNELQEIIEMDVSARSVTPGL